MSNPPRHADTESFVSRWSRRKLEGEHPSPADDGQPIEADPAVPPDPEPDSPPQKTDADMPPVDSIGEASSVADFFSAGVSDSLRQAALRKLFHLPKFNVVDGLDDYDDDFRRFAALGDIVTADMRRRAEVEAERLRERAERALTAEGDDDTQPPVAEQESDSGVAQTEKQAAKGISRARKARAGDQGEHGEDDTV